MRYSDSELNEAYHIGYNEGNKQFNDNKENKIKNSIIKLIHKLSSNQVHLGMGMIMLNDKENTIVYEMYEKEYKKLNNRKKAYEQGIYNLLNKLN